MAFSSVHIIGPGALGLGLAVDLASRRLAVSVSGRAGALARGEACVGGRWRSASFALRPEPGSLVVIAVKGPDMDGVICCPATLGCSAVLLLRNGLASKPELPCPTVDGVVWACAWRDRDGRAIWRGSTAIDLPDDALGRNLAELLNGENVEARLVPSIEKVRFRKLMVNAGVNPLSALWRSDCRTLASRPEVVAEATAIAAEVKGLAAAAGVMVEDDPAALVASALAGMGDFTPSMEQDRATGRPLELKAIVDAPLQMAAALKMEMPVLASLRARLLQRLAH
ncbi:ketopantoate reductase family protein [Rhodospirillum sp. A1_3_36]|uniref:ketopantoate reductase family protein n=1 Tax=Rhodospirillum sp. A1_3_36 TaxID=3391666 RepID=UPI0039A4A8A8